MDGEQLGEIELEQLREEYQEYWESGPASRRRAEEDYTFGFEVWKAAYLRFRRSQAPTFHSATGHSNARPYPGE